MNIANIVRSKLGLKVSRTAEYNWILNRISPNTTVLDVGCVRGNEIQKLTRDLLFKRTCTVYGVSLQPFRDVMHKEPRFPEAELIKQQKMRTFFYRQGNILESDYAKEKFDYIIASHILQHLGMPYFNLNSTLGENGDLMFIHKARSWLKSNGRLFILVPIAKKEQLIISSSYKYKVYSLESIKSLIAGKFIVVDGIVFDTAYSTKKIIKDAKALLWELKKA